MPLQQTKKAKVIVLGAGLAGLSAALILQKHHIDVVVLEARDRVGGRVMTQVISEHPRQTIELGGEWIGTMHTRMKQLCKDFSLRLLDHRLKMDVIYNRTYYPFGKWKFSNTFDTRLRTALEGIDMKNKEDLAKLDTIDLWHYLVKNHIQQRDLELLDLIESANFGESIRSATAADIPYLLVEFLKRDFTKSTDAYSIKGGNNQLTEKMSKKIGLENIKLEHVATHINQSEDQVEITCTDGSVWRADRVICTLPGYSLGKLKWSPELPQKKQDAFAALNYNRVMKCAVVFRERFWKKENFEVFTDTFSHYLYHATQNQPGKSGVITALVTGDLAYTFSQLTKEQQKKEICKTLQIPFGEVEDQAIDVIRYYWGDDPYTKGGYAIYKKYDETFLFHALSEPYKKVFFAGEHIAQVFQGFMEGAVQSGQESAADVIRSLVEV